MRTGTTYRPIPGPKRNISQEARLRAAEAAQEAPAPAQTTSRPQTPEEAELRFWRRYGPQLLAAFIGPYETPTTVDGWIALARRYTNILDAPAAARQAVVEQAKMLEQLAAQLRGSVMED